MYPHSIKEDNGRLFMTWFSSKEASSNVIPRPLIPMKGL